jgi:hypothetical protein
VCPPGVQLGAYPKAFERPLALPTLHRGTACPVTAGEATQTAGFAGFAVGVAPARPVLPIPVDGDVHHGFAAVGPSTSSPWYSVKTLWSTVPGYSGAVRIRGARIDGPGVMAFGEAPPRLAELIIPPGPTRNEGSDGYRTAPGATWVTAPGCYAWQSDGEGFSVVNVVLIVAAGPSASAEGSP